MIASIGELLWDRFPDGRKVAGGAPFNFAYHCNRLGHFAAIVSAVGDDALGRELRELIKQHGMTDEYIQTDPAFSTGTVEVTFKGRGQNQYEIHDDVAWDAIEWDESLAQLASKARIICHGSLGMRSETSRQTIRRLGSYSTAGVTPALRLFDVNLRPPFVDYEIIKDTLSKTPWVKLNHEELAELSEAFEISERRLIEMYIKNYSQNGVWIITRGADGVEIVTADDEFKQSGVPVKELKDTVGAGDAFTAAMVCLYYEGKPLKDCARFATHYASKVCEYQGATPAINRAEIEKIAFRKWWRVW